VLVVWTRRAKEASFFVMLIIAIGAGQPADLYLSDLSMSGHPWVAAHIEIPRQCFVPAAEHR
jgi:hypothetical protein